MDTTPFPERLTALQALEMIGGPTVDIFVGPQARRYLVPKQILCYYSEFFNRGFSGCFPEAENSKLVLQEDDPQKFEHLLDFMIAGPRQVVPEGDEKTQFDYIFTFMHYAGQYNLAEAGMMFFDALSKLLSTREKTTWFHKAIIYTIFAQFPEGHDMRVLVAKFALVTGFFSDPEELDETQNHFDYTDEEKCIHGFSDEVINQLKIHRWRTVPVFTIRHPFDNKFFAV